MSAERPTQAAAVGLGVPMRVKDAIGRFGEQRAVEYLTDEGLTVLDRNWRCPDGEIDVIAREGDSLVFIEVKTRTTRAFGDPAEAVVPAKAARLRRLAARWLVEHADQHWPAVRFDVVAVVRRGPDGPSLRHVRGAF